MNVYAFLEIHNFYVEISHQFDMKSHHKFLACDKTIVSMYTCVFIRSYIRLHAGVLDVRILLLLPIVRFTIVNILVSLTFGRYVPLSWHWRIGTIFTKF